MSGRDARILSREVLAELRRVAVTLSLEGYKAPAIAAVVDVHEQTVRRWLRRYKKEGATLFEPPTGRGHPQPKLSAEQSAWLKQAMTDHTPTELGLDGEWWTPPLAQALVHKQFGVNLGDSTTYEYLHRWGFRPRVPLRRAVKRDPKQIQEWMETTWPRVVKAVADGAKVVFLDEAQVREDHVQPRVWAPTSERPVMDVSGKRARVNLISAVSLKGELWWKCYTESLDSARFCQSLAALYAQMGAETLLVVVDQLRVHFSEETTAWLAEHLPNLRLVKLPTYCPELNPDEQVWAHLKGILHRFNPLKIGEHIAEAAVVEMYRLREQPEKIRQFFFHPDLEYLHPLAREIQGRVAAK